MNATRTPRPDLPGEEAVRSQLDQLLENSRLYKTSSDYRQLLDFVVRLRSFAPFNAMLLHIQKPGIRYAASAQDWLERFGRVKKEGARPLLILWPFGPVALVYDLDDTEGGPLPEDVATAFSARGDITNAAVAGFVARMALANIRCKFFDGGDGSAGLIRSDSAMPVTGEDITYTMLVNRNHSAGIQFVTIAHELAHLFLGHLGPNKALKIPNRSHPVHDKAELEAESVAFIVAGRNGVEPKSQAYLTNHVKPDTTIESLDLYQIMRAAGQVESLLGLATR